MELASPIAMPAGRFGTATIRTGCRAREEHHRVGEFLWGLGRGDARLIAGAERDFTHWKDKDINRMSGSGARRFAAVSGDHDVVSPILPEVAHRRLCLADMAQRL